MLRRCSLRDVQPRDLIERNVKRNTTHRHTSSISRTALYHLYLDAHLISCFERCLSTALQNLARPWLFSDAIYEPDTRWEHKAPPSGIVKSRSTRKKSLGQWRRSGSASSVTAPMGLSDRNATLLFAASVRSCCFRCVLLLILHAPLPFSLSTFRSGDALEWSHFWNAAVILSYRR